MAARSLLKVATWVEVAAPERHSTRARAQRAMRQLSEELKTHVFHISESHVESELVFCGPL